MKHHKIKMAETPAECNAITHDGPFHGDDVFACAILLTLGPVTLLRTRDPSIISEKISANDIIIFDVGGSYEPSVGLYDHHQTDFCRTRDNGIPYASAGLIWEEYAELVLALELYSCAEEDIQSVKERVDRNLIQGIDARDYGLVSNDISMTVSGFISLYNPRWDDQYLYNERFLAAVEEAYKILHMTILNAISIGRGKKAVGEIVNGIKDDSTEVLVFPQFIGGWQSQIVNMESDAAKRLKFVVYKDAKKKNQYNAQAVPLNYASTQSEVRAVFPVEWRGVSESRLSQMTGIESALYCHKAGHLAIASTEEGAIALANLALKTMKQQADSVEETEENNESAALMNEEVREFYDVV